MRSRSLVGAVLLVAVPLLSALALPSGAVAAPPLCFGQRATHVMKPGDPPYIGTSDDEVVVGSKGNDYIKLDLGDSGTDLACGGGGNDDIAVKGPGSKADGGAGADVVEPEDGGLALGGAGDDSSVQVFGYGGRAEGGSGSDSVWAHDGAAGDGGSGNDAVLGVGAAALLGGSGSDNIANGGGNPKIDCGSGFDLVGPNGATDVRRCEQIL